MIDKATVNLYTCCKCGHQWVNWDSKQKKEGPIPKNCPSCRNVRWNRSYTGEEIALINQFEKQYSLHHKLMDFIAYDFLCRIEPKATMSEIRQVLAIPKSKVEARHELMLSIILDRVANREKYHKEQPFAFENYWWSDEALGIPLGEMMEKYIPERRSRMKGCNHQEISSEVRDVLYPDTKPDIWKGFQIDNKVVNQPDF